MDPCCSFDASSGGFLDSCGDVADNRRCRRYPEAAVIHTLDVTLDLSHGA